MNWKLKGGETATTPASNKETLSFRGSGKVSVSVESIVSSPKVQRQVSGVKEIAAANKAAAVKPK